MVRYTRILDATRAGLTCFCYAAPNKSQPKYASSGVIWWVAFIVYLNLFSRAFPGSLYTHSIVCGWEGEAYEPTNERGEPVSLAYLRSAYPK